jgi:alkanesulfonate monooxygenase SsuD/methylene tetrahydromethanopterin reductase-like flavin-dependent oxidoreductase (luciferase family)
VNPQVGVVLEHQSLPLEDTLQRAALVDDLGAASTWLVQMPNQRESGTVLAGMACRTSRCTIASAILPIYSRPPVVMAHTALTLDELSGGRFILGLGLGHRGVGEWMVGAGAAPPAVPAMREYLLITISLIREGEVTRDGQWFSGHAFYASDLARRPAMPVHVGGFGPKIIELAAELADGVILWMCTPGYIREHAMPALRKGWARRIDGRYPDGMGFQVTAMLNAAITTDPAEDVEWFQQFITAYLRVPAYQRLFTASGFAEQVSTGRGDQAMTRALALIGSPEDLHRRMAAYLAAGTTHIAISPVASAHVEIARFLDTVRGGLR